MTTENTEASCCAAPTSQLSEREQAVVVLAAAMALDNRSALKEAMMEAKQLGITNAEINVINQVVMSLQASDCCGSALDMVDDSGSSACCR